MSKNFNLDKFLKEEEALASTCPFCKDAKLKSTLAEFMQKKAAGETFITLNRLFDRCLVPLLGAPKNQKALYNHVRNCMGLDPKTGKPLNDKT